MCTNAQLTSGGGGRQPPAAIVRFVVHAAIAWVYGHTMWMSSSVDWDAIVFPTVSEVGKFMSYMLTLWALSMHLGFFTLASFLDFFELMPQSVIVGKLLNKIREVNDFFFMTMMMPISMCVCSGFWAAWVLFYEIIYPNGMAEIIPTFINHVSHTTPIFLVVIELFFCYHQTPRVKSAVTSLLTLEILYLATLFVQRVQHGRWVYLLIDIYVNTVPKFIFVFSFLSFIVPIFYLVSLMRFNDYIWGIPRSNVNSKNVSHPHKQKAS